MGALPCTTTVVTKVTLALVLPIQRFLFEEPHYLHKHIQSSTSAFNSSLCAFCILARNLPAHTGEDILTLLTLLLLFTSIYKYATD